MKLYRGISGEPMIFTPEELIKAQDYVKRVRAAMSEIPMGGLPPDPENKVSGTELFFQHLERTSGLTRREVEIGCNPWALQRQSFTDSLKAALRHGTEQASSKEEYIHVIVLDVDDKFAHDHADFTRTIDGDYSCDLFKISAKELSLLQEEGRVKVLNYSEANAELQTEVQNRQGEPVAEKKSLIDWGRLFRRK